MKQTTLQQITECVVLILCGACILIGITWAVGIEVKDWFAKRRRSVRSVIVEKGGHLYVVTIDKVTNTADKEAIF